MYFVESGKTDPCYNLALEEYLFTAVRDEDIVMLWQNEPSVIVGKYQNVFEEINVKQAMLDGIRIVRRNSGGGTVFHDLGNLNYTIIMDFDADTFDGYDRFLAPVIQALENMGVSAKKRRSCDIAIGEEKISGSAQCVKKGRILHHGTLLFDSDLEALRKYLRSTDAVVTSKAVKSVRSQVTNVAEHMGRQSEQNWSMTGVKEELKRSLSEKEVSEICLNKEDERRISELMREKYETWEWNYGKSPKFTLERQAVIDGRKMNIFLEVSRGMIRSFRAEAAENIYRKLEAALTGVRYDYSDIYRKVREVTGKTCLQCEQIADVMF